VVIGKPGHVEVEGSSGDFRERGSSKSRRISSDFHSQTVTGDFANDAAAREGARADRSDPQGAARRGGALQRYRLPATKNRQNALRKLIAECDTLVVVGGRNSNNTLQLVPQRP